MAEESAKLRIPYIAAAQAQKHVTHNEAMTLLDTLVQLSVLDKDLTAPPGSPAEGDCYIVAGGGGTATDAWEGWERRVARYIDGEWRSYLPGTGSGAGWLAWVFDEDAMYRFDGAAWTLAGIEGPEGPAGPAGADGADGQSFQPDAVVALIAGRDAYDDEAAAFSVLVVSDSSNGDEPTLYFKLSAASADWSDPITWGMGSGSGDPPIWDVFESSDTWTKRTGLKAVEIWGWGPGGAGGGAVATGSGQSSAGGGGGAGASGFIFIDAADLGATETVTIGAAGTGSAGATGGSGGTSSFGSHIAFPGGNGGSIIASPGTSFTAASAGEGGGPCTGTGALAGYGASGTLGFRNANIGIPGVGGSSTYGEGGVRGAIGSGEGVGSAGTGYGSGGSGAANGLSASASAGGDGAPSLILVRNHF